MNYKAICLISGICTAFNVCAADMHICGDLKQGEMIMLKDIPANVKSLKMNNRIYPITEDRSALMAFHRDEKSKIVMFYTGTIEPQAVIDAIKNAVPDYMIPNKKVKLDKMPINLNGKIDRVELKKML